MKSYLTRPIAVIVFTVGLAGSALAQSGPSGPGPAPSGIPNNGPIGQISQLSPDRLVNFLRQDGHQADAKKLTNGDHLVTAVIQRDGWRFVLEFEFTGGGKNMNVICPLGNPTSQFSSAQLLQLMKKSYELPVPLHFSYRANDQRLCLEDPCYNTMNMSDAGVRSIMERMMKTARETHPLWDTSRWPLNGPAAGGQPAAPATPIAAPIVAPSAPAAPQGLAKSVWIGSESLQGYARLEFRFEAHGKVTMIDTDGSHPGTYTQQGNTVTLRFYDGGVVYSGTINGTVLAGTAQNGKATWNFTVNR
jgi:hypothetical protein